MNLVGGVLYTPILPVSFQAGGTVLGVEPAKRLALLSAIGTRQRCVSEPGHHSFALLSLCSLLFIDVHLLARLVFSKAFRGMRPVPRRRK